MAKFVYQNEVGEFNGDNFVHTTLKKALLDYCRDYEGKIQDGIFTLSNGDTYPMDRIESEVKGMNYITFRDADGESVLTVQRLEVF